MKRKARIFLKVAAAMLLLVAMTLCAIGCGNDEAEVDWQAKATELQSSLAAANAANADLQSQLANLQNKLETAEQMIQNFQSYPSIHEYDFYMTLGTMPTLYATLNAYEEKNPNTYMWFYRGNTISYEYTAEHIHYFSSQSQTNAYSTIDYTLIRNKIKDIKAMDPQATFTLYCDDLRVSFILQFVYCGIDFEDLNIVLLSDGTATYDIFANQNEAEYANYAAEWNALVDLFEAARGNAEFTSEHMKDGDQATTLQKYAFYLSTLPNVQLWVQHPQYLTNSSAVLMAEKELMNIVHKNPKEMYENLDDDTRAAYQKVVLANALVDSDTLHTLDEAVAYFDSQLANRDKDVVLILGASKPNLAENKPYLDQTVAYYTPTRSATDATKVTYKGVEYTVDAAATTVEVGGKTLTIGELGVYLFFKGHPAYPAAEDLQAYFAEHGIVVLPHRTPVETLFWMYDVKAGGYNSTSFLSCHVGQTEFFYGDISGTVASMDAAGFFAGAARFTA